MDFQQEFKQEYNFGLVLVTRDNSDIQTLVFFVVVVVVFFVFKLGCESRCKNN